MGVTKTQIVKFIRKGDKGDAGENGITISLLPAALTPKVGVSRTLRVQVALYDGLKFYQDACTLDPYKEASLFDKNVCTIHGDQDITASCECSYKYKEIFKERAKCIIVKGAEHRFKSFVFREARMKGALDFLKDELL